MIYIRRTTMNIYANYCIRSLDEDVYQPSLNEPNLEFTKQNSDYSFSSFDYLWKLILLEHIILLFTKKADKFHLHDGITSIGIGMLMETTRLLCRGMEIKFYVYIYEHHCMNVIPWHSSVTWIVAAIGVDFAYYWVHRACHEVNLFWSAHQIHHSSQYFNFTTAVRQSVFQFMFAWPFYLPLALFIPPSVFLLHHHINYMYQFWTHSMVIRKLPAPIEFIFNTPNHHRVHHGCNRYCLDKNYGGWLIIWDRIFGTFQEEKEEILYGLISNVNSFNPIWLQILELRSQFQRFHSTDGVLNKLKVLFYSPAWTPGRPRMGLEHEKPDIHPPRPVYKPDVAPWLSMYIVLHFIIVVNAFLRVYTTPNPFSLESLLLISFIALSLTSFGSIMDTTSWSYSIECVRCATVCWIGGTIAMPVYVHGIFLGSAFIWPVLLAEKQLLSRKQKLE